jgi:DNA-binding transcriptional MerR regulator
MFTTGDVARYLDISQSTVINYIEKGFLKPDLTLPSSNARSGRRKFKKETVDAFYEKYLQ